MKQIRPVVHGSSNRTAGGRGDAQTGKFQIHTCYRTSKETCRWNAHLPLQCIRDSVVSSGGRVCGGLGWAGWSGLILCPVGGILSYSLGSWALKEICAVAKCDGVWVGGPALGRLPANLEQNININLPSCLACHALLQAVSVWPLVQR
jgi:hypothetical protein